MKLIPARPKNRLRAIARQGPSGIVCSSSVGTSRGVWPRYGKETKLLSPNVAMASPHTIIISVTKRTAGLDRFVTDKSIEGTGKWGFVTFIHGSGIETSIAPWFYNAN
jgi:hypothetical protein